MCELGEGETYQAQLLTGIGLDVDAVRSDARAALVAGDGARLVSVAREEERRRSFLAAAFERYEPMAR